MTSADPEVDARTEKIIGCAIEVHRTLGPGLLESLYRECMIIEMRSEHLRVETERHVHLEYKGQRINGELRTLRAGLRRLDHPNRYVTRTS